MVKEYLFKTRDGLMEERISWVEKVNSLHNKIKENIQMIQLLEDTNDPNFEAFTPREVNGYNRKKIVELEEEQQLLSEEISEARHMVSEYDNRIDEINSVIKVAKEDFINPLDYENKNSDLKPDFKRALLESVENERQRISRDLHDQTAQNLTSLIHKTELCMKLVDVDPIRSKLELSVISKTLREVVEDTRKMIYDLRPMSFDDIGFDITVERFIDKFKKTNNVRCLFKVEGEPYQIDHVVALTLLRVIQEACSNSVKHAEASSISVQLIYDKDNFVVEISDDGKGFDLNSIPTTTRDDNSGFGLSMMKERIYLLSGELQIDSSLGNGCKTRVIIPVNKEE